MEVIYGRSRGQYDDPVFNLGFEAYTDVARDCYLFLSDFHHNITSSAFNDKEKVVLTLEEPNFCLSNRGDLGCVTAHEYADKILTLCPYTAECFDEREQCWFPIDDKFEPENKEKEIDFFYIGQAPTFPAGSFKSYFDNVLVPNYNTQLGFWHNAGTDHIGRFNASVTNVNYAGKLEYFAKAKATLVHGIDNFWRHGSSPQQFLDFPRSFYNKAFTHLEDGIIPQLKSRVFEAALCKTLMLCQRDPWNVIEYYFTPGEDFIYIDNENHLKEVAEDVINNYDKYNFMVENAYNKLKNNYTTKHFVDKFLK